MLACGRCLSTAARKWPWVCTLHSLHRRLCRCPSHESGGKGQVVLLGEGARRRVFACSRLAWRSSTSGRIGPTLSDLQRPNRIRRRLPKHSSRETRCQRPLIGAVASVPASLQPAVSDAPGSPYGPRRRYSNLRRPNAHPQSSSTQVPRSSVVSACARTYRPHRSVAPVAVGTPFECTSYCNSSA